MAVTVQAKAGESLDALLRRQGVPENRLQEVKQQVVDLNQLGNADQVSADTALIFPDSFVAAGATGGGQTPAYDGMLRSTPRGGASGGMLGFLSTRDEPAAATRQPNPHQREIDRALRWGERDVVQLKGEVIDSATLDEKVAMLKTLRMENNPNSEDPSAIRPEQRGAVARRILEAAPDAGTFDYLMTRIDSKQLSYSLNGTDDQAIQALKVKHRTVKPGDWDSYGPYLETVTGQKPSGQNKVGLLVDGVQARPAVRDALDAAKDSINLSVFQLQPDEIGYALADKLGEKVKQGVKVRVLVDECGTNSDGEEEADKLIDYMKGKGIDIKVNESPLLKSDLDHRKVMVIDGTVGFTGGMNIGQSYQEKWHDQTTKVEGPAVRRMQEAFVDHWRREKGTEPTADELKRMFPALDEVADGSATHVVAHEKGTQDRNIKAAYLRAIKTAESSIRIANPYFSDDDVIRELCNAAKRGVNVQVVLPAENDMAILKRASEAYYPDLIGAGVEVYEYQGRMAHQKVATIDGKWATVGSSNLDDRSLRINDELNLVVTDPKFAADLNQRMFDVDIAQSKRITEADPSLRSRIDRLIHDIL